MSTDKRDYQQLVEALRAPTSRDEDQREMEQRLVSRGILSAGSAATVVGSATHARADASFGVKLAGALKPSALITMMAGVGALVVSSATFSGPERPMAPRPADAPRANSSAASVPLTSVPHPYAGAASAPRVVASHSETSREPRPVLRRHTRRSTREPGGDALSLRRENALLLEATELIHAGNFAGADALLTQYEREFPDGILAREHQLARARLAKSFAP